jgi:hypothetical protein
MHCLFAATVAGPPCPSLTAGAAPVRGEADIPRRLVLVNVGYKRCDAAIHPRLIVASLPRCPFFGLVSATDKQEKWETVKPSIGVLRAVFGSHFSASDVPLHRFLNRGCAYACDPVLTYSSKLAP